MTPEFDMAMERFGGRSEWVGRVGSRVLPTTVSVVDDPTATDFQNEPLLGGFVIDDEGVTAQRIAIVENGILKGLLMSRRPGPDFQGSNGHARSADLSDTNPAASNLFFQASDGLSAADMQKKFIDACKDNGQQWCIEVKRMDDPALSSVSQQDFSDFIGEVAGGIATGERVPLEMYRVYVSDGHTELVRGGTIEGLSLREMRNMLAIGNDPEVYTYMQNSTEGFSGTALASFGAAQGGIPSTVVAPSLLLDDIEVRGFHGEPRRVPLVAAPPFK